MIRLGLVAALLAASPASASVLLGTTAFGTLVNDAVSDQGFPGRGTGTGTVAGGGLFLATTNLSEAGRQVWRYTFSLPERSNLRVELGWIYQVEYNCKPDTFPCGYDDVNKIDQTFTTGIDRVRIDVTRAGGRTRHYDPLATFIGDGLDFFENGEGFYRYEYDRNASLALAPGDYAFDFTGYGAPGGPAFPGSGGGFHNVNLEAIAVPEPSAWAMMLCGVALTGATLRRRQAVTASRA